MAACRPQLGIADIATGDFDQSLDPRGVRPASWRPARLQLLARSARKRNLRSLGLVTARLYADWNMERLLRSSLCRAKQIKACTIVVRC